ncbi:uncharacterized protein [Montipora foliosa]|uniref:uncharacterized protein n=1 Tax=Montipora foliosa TaxID=591990 RepID=UPI0035F1F846
MEMDKFIQVGEKFGLEGEKLLEFVEKQQILEQDRRREEEEKEEKRRQLEEEREEMRRRFGDEKEERRRLLEEDKRREDEERETRRQERKLRTFEMEAELLKHKEAIEAPPEVKPTDEEVKACIKDDKPLLASGVELSQECSSKHNAEVKILVGEDDSATIKMVKKHVSHHVEKWSDINHAKKSFTIHLYAIQSQFKGQLSAKVIEYFSNCFGYALVQNRNNTEGLKKDLKAIVPHAFAKHDQHCSISWCGFLKDPFNKLPSQFTATWERSTRGEAKKEELEKVMANFVKNADKLAPLGSSQANESLNNTIGSKAPKIRHYGASESNDFRVACAVSQKNIGHTYVSELAAIHGTDEFNVYIIPSHRISPSAAAVNKLSVKNGHLFYDGRPVAAVQLAVAFDWFLDWLQSLKQPCLLFAHNAKLFDDKHLQRALEKSNQTTRFQELVPGFCDTLSAFKEVLPNRKSYSQENLAMDLLQATYSAHNALSDVRMLQELFNKFLKAKVVEKHSFSFSWLQEYIQFLNQKRQNLKTLQPLIAKAISKGIAEKAARSGLSYAHLVLAFKSGGVEGLSNVFKEMFNGKARVTGKREIIQQMCTYFREHTNSV